MELHKNIIVNNDEFEIVAISNNELKENYTTLDVLNLSKKNGYIQPTKDQSCLIKQTLNTHTAKDVFNAWVMIALYKDETSYCKNGACIVSGILYDNEGKNIPEYGKDINHEWGQGITFVFLSPKK